MQAALRAREAEVAGWQAAAAEARCARQQAEAALQAEHEALGALMQVLRAVGVAGTHNQSARTHTHTHTHRHCLAACTRSAQPP